MVRLDFDSERLKALRAELDQQTALLPAVLQSSDAVALVDHLITVFNEADWTRTARCSGFVEAAPSSEPSGWEAFQSVLREESRPTKAQCDAQAKDSALSRLQADIDNIKQTTCLPPSRLAALTASSSDQHGHLQAVRCTVCHSLLLAAAFNDHLPRCRPCALPSAVPSTSSHPSSSGRLASRPNSARGRAAAKKGKGRGRGSKKPPAGPSRFAMEQGKTPPQRQTTPRPPPTDFDHQLPAQPSQQQQQHHHPLTEATASALPSDHDSPEFPLGGMSGSQRHPAGTSSPPAARQHSKDTDAAQDRVSQERSMTRSRSAWTYAEHLRRSNPELDAVHDPMLPPRFPHNVTRMRCRNRTHSDETPQPLCESHPQTSPQGLTHAAASPLSGKAAPLRSSKQEGMPQRGNERLLVPQQKPGVSSSQRPGHEQQQAPHRHQQHTNGLQPHSPPTSWQLPGSAHQGAKKPWQDSACHSQQSLSASHAQHRSGAAVLGQKRLLHDYLPGAPQHSDQRQQQAAQLPPLHMSAHSRQQDAQTTAAAHGQQQQPALLQPAGRLPSGSFKFKGSAQHSMHGSASNHAKLYKPSATNGLQGEYAAQPATNDSRFDTSHMIELKPSNGFRIPKSKRQVSVNALARSSLGT